MIKYIEINFEIASAQCLRQRFISKQNSKRKAQKIKDETHLCFLTAENFSDMMCFKKLKQKKNIWEWKKYVQKKEIHWLKSKRNTDNVFSKLFVTMYVVPLPDIHIFIRVPIHTLVIKKKNHIYISIYSVLWWSSLGSQKSLSLLRYDSRHSVHLDLEIVFHLLWRPS